MEDWINNLKRDSMGWNNYGGQHNFDADLMNFMNYMGMDGLSALGFRGFDADIRGYFGYSGNNSAFGFNMPTQDIMEDKKKLTNWIDAQVAAQTMTTYKFRIFYTPGGGGSHDSVDITLFIQAYNNGSFVNGDLVFTNSLGDTATIRGLTKNLLSTVTMQSFMLQLQTQPAILGFMRILAKSGGQLAQPFSVLHATQYGGSTGNNITPNDYIDPDQYQFLRVDVPFNIPISLQHGLQWTIDQDQTGTGVDVTMFMPVTHNPIKSLHGQNPTRTLNDGVVPPFFTPTNASNTGRPLPQNQQLIALAQNPVVKNIIANKTIPQQQGVNLIRALAQ